MLEKSFCMIKPDGIARGLEKEIIGRIERSGLKITQKKIIRMDAEQSAALYQPHFGEKFYDGLIRFIISGPVAACVVEGEGAIAGLRRLMGATDPLKAESGTIRGDLKELNSINEYGIIKNLIHGSDSIESAEREIKIFFPN